MKKIIALVCIAAVFAVFAAGCVTPSGTQEPAEPIDYATALIGEWKSVDTYSTSAGDGPIVYKFNSDNTGTAGQEVNGVVKSSTDTYWGYNSDDNNYAVGYVKTSTVYLFTMSSDGKSIYDSSENQFNKI